ncbi:MAG: hypothetical protein OER90_10170 [Gemmatimonadota bacterium]|nr:hypothetical protein [Gemmatimonadota bacterium]
MKRLGSVMITVACVAALAACEGPAGPAGVPGGEGPQGPAGPAGPPGVDATANCTQCHVSDVTLFAKQVQYQQSTHRLGGNFERNATSCAICHTHQGFLERVASGAYATAQTIQDPAPINCRTCHQIHTTYTDADYAFTATTPFDLYNEDYATGNTITKDYGAAAGNLCARCHQARKLSSGVANGAVPQINGPDVQVTSTRYGTHHGPQAQVLAGVGLYEFSGSETVLGQPTSHGDPAKNVRLCATCHMATAAGVEYGGHTWRVAFLSNGSKEENVAGCNLSQCHNGAVDDFTALGDVQAQILPLLQQLDTLLVNAGIKQIISPGYTIHDLNARTNTGTYPANIAAAMLNWQLITEDRSLGLHNAPYVRAVLTNTIEAITP